MEKFAIFGGVSWGKIDTTKPSYALIEELILKDYSYIRNDITELTDGQPLYHSILTAVAQSDGKLHAVFKRANVAEDVGQKAVETLRERGILRQKRCKGADDKLFFTTPFLRFWFAFVSPLFKGIRDGDFSEIKERWQRHENEFTHLTFKELSAELLRETFKEDSIMEMSEYWQNDALSIDIYGLTKSKKRVVGICKYTNTKVKKSELTRLQELCHKANIQADIFVLIAKKGFSSELKSQKSQQLKLYTLKNFKALVE
ncbi:DUF234 domain-containing protein [Sulfurimonas sp.]